MKAYFRLIKWLFWINIVLSVLILINFKKECNGKSECFTWHSKAVHHETRITEQIFDLVYINLDRNKPKRDHMEQLLRFSGLNYNRFSAVDGMELFRNKSYLSTLTNSSQLKEKLSMTDGQLRGQTGCWMSHSVLLSQIANSNTNRPTVILEDDVDLDINFKDIIIDSIVNLPRDWDVLLCGYCCLQPKFSLAEYYFFSQPNWHIFPVGSYFATHCQVVRNSSTARRLYEKIKLPLKDTAVDSVFSNLAYNGEFKFYALKHLAAIQRRDLFTGDIPTSGRLTQDYLAYSMIDLMRKKHQF